MTSPPTLALDKALSLLSLLVADGGASSVTALADEAGLPAATAHRIVATFERRGFLTRIARGRYLPGPALLRIASAASMESVLQTTGRPLLDHLARSTGLTAHLGVFEGDMVTYLVKAGRAGEGLFTREGMQLEAYCSAVGKVLLAALPDAQRDHYLANGPFIRLTAHTIADPGALRLELDRVRREGVARDEREVDADLRCIAAPVLDQGGAAQAAISLSALQTLREVDPGEHIEALKQTARILGERLYPLNTS